MAGWFGRSIRFGILVAAVADPLLIQAAEKTERQLVMTLVVRNYAGIPPQIREPAEAQVANTFAAIGVRVMFAECGLDPEETKRCESAQDGSGAQLRVHLEPRSFLV